MILAPVLLAFAVRADEGDDGAGLFATAGSTATGEQAPAPPPPGSPLDIDLDQLATCSSVQAAPAGGSGGGSGPQVSVAPESVGDTAELRRLTSRVAARIERLRGLSFERPIEAAFLGDEALKARVSELGGEQYGPRQADLDGRILAALGAIPPDADLLDLSAATLEGQIAGLYVPASGELLVRSSEGEPGAVEELTLAHELEHALADQALGLPVPDEPQPGRSDQLAAALALVEGDASLSMQLYSTEYLSFADQLSLLGEEGVADAEEQLAAVPDFLQRQLLFPYTDGLSYACERAAAGGLRAVDDAYGRRPGSTWEILFPERSAAGRPVDPADPGRLADPWRRVERTEVGAADLSWLFAAPGGDRAAGLEDPEGAVLGWEGGELELWTDGADSAIGISLAARGEGLCLAVDEWYRATFPEAEPSEPEPGVVVSDGPDQDAVISCGSGTVRVGIAPGVATASELVKR